MKLYHGTTERHLTAILQDGLLPREDLGRESNWDKYPSRDDMVYLTTAYPFYFALYACEAGEQALVVEVDTDGLDDYAFFPDEDFISQALSKKGFTGVDKEVHDDVLVNLEGYQEHWQMSVEKMGNCSYQGIIDPEDITRYCLFDSSTRPYVAMSLMDPSISIMNYHFCSEKYLNLVAWFFGDTELLSDPLAGFQDESEMVKKTRAHWLAESADRTGVEVVNVCP